LQYPAASARAATPSGWSNSSQMASPAAILGAARSRLGLTRSRPSISRKLRGAVAVAVLAAMTVIGGAAALQEATRHTRSRLDYLNATAAVFASATSRALVADDRNSALQALRGVARAPDLMYARVERIDGTRLAEIGAGVALASDAELQNGATLSPLAALGSRTLKVSQPIVHAGAPVGRIVLVADNAGLAPGLIATLGQALLGTLIAIVIAVGVADRLRKRVTGPLLQLAAAVRHIARSHDYSARVDIESDDEVGDLCGGFNTMLSEIKEREDRIVDLALHDSETDLPNRMAFEREIERRLAAGGAFAVAAVGIDRFQMIRGAIGYQLSNDLIAELGARLALEHASRIANDVIGCILDADSVEAARDHARTLQAEAEAPVLLGENTLDINVSIGLTMLDPNIETPRAFVERANVAVDQARAARQKVHLFDEAAYMLTASNVTLMGEMMRALHNGQMAVHLQPKYDIRAGAVTGAELLVRWRHPDRGPISPDLFIGMAEETGVIGVFTEWTLRQAIAVQQRLAAEGLAPAIAVNLSGRLLDDDAFLATAVELLNEAPAQIYLEITETATIDNQDAALHNIAALKAAGARISLDDYGQGLSSLSYLRRIPADELKIDKAFILRLSEQQRDGLLVKSTIDLAHSLGLRVTAEGVETQEVLAALAGMGCDMAQGYFIARPMPEADFTRFLKDAAPVETRRASAGYRWQRVQ